MCSQGKCSICRQMTNFMCMSLEETKPLSANHSLLFKEPFLSLFLMPWSAQSPAPGRSAAPHPQTPVVSRPPSCRCSVLCWWAPLPLSTHTATGSNHWPWSGHPLTIQHVGKVLPGWPTAWEELGQRVKADAPWESTERTRSFLKRGKWAFPCGLLSGGYKWDFWIGGGAGRKRQMMNKNSQLHRCNFNSARDGNDARYCPETGDAGGKEAHQYQSWVGQLGVPNSTQMHDEWGHSKTLTEVLCQPKPMLKAVPQGTVPGQPLPAAPRGEANTSRTQQWQPVTL